MLKCVIFAACCSIVAMAVPFGKEIASSIFEHSSIFDNLSKQGKLDWINKIADKLIAEMSTLMGKMPLKLPDVQKNFSYTLLYVNYEGSLSLNNGRAADVFKVFRNADSILERSGKVVTFNVPITFSRFGLDYDYSTKLVKVGPSGGINGSVVDVEVLLSTSLNFANMKLTLNKFGIIRIGDISLKFTGHKYFDYIINILTKVVMKIFKNTVTWITKDYVRNKLKEIIDMVNKNMGKLLPI